ncbi:sperm-associated antigen 7 homolog [Clytia hemisphaerica]|uniref:sperm-associated antigen 7 homolog n=1 Tax=Clytia hemisphaerica TaxID=252671 RepID=UPI0034D59AF0
MKKDKFLQDIERRINKFLQGPAEEKKLTFEVMGKVERTLAHEVAETAGLCSYSFGEEDVDRHLVVWKKEYDPNKAKFVAAKSEESEKESEASTVTRKRKSVNNQTEKYFEKYAKILGEESGLDAAKIAKSNASYGMVPSKNKEDKRSIEETMKEIRERKKQKESSANAT